MSKLVPRRFRTPPAAAPLKPDSIAVLQRLVNLSGCPQATFHLELDGESQVATLTQGRGERMPADQVPSSHVERPNPPFADSSTPGLDDGDDTIYPVASITKIFINVAYHRLLSSNQYAASGLAWEASACDLFNKLRSAKDRSRIQRITRDPTIRELLLHRNAFAPMNRELFAPDGTFIMSAADFLAIAPRATELYFKGQQQGFTVYSNANHIFAGMLLEEITGMSLNEAMEKLVFGPLKMLHTVMDTESLLRAQTEGARITQGHRTSAHMALSVLPRDHNYLRDTVEVASMGAYSCPGDIAKLIREFLKALDGESSFFSEIDALDFFGPKWDSEDGGQLSLGGLLCNIDSSLAGSESLQTILVPELKTTGHRLGKLTNGSCCKLYYKAGAVDGYTSTLYVSLKHRMFVVVLANSSGPVDVTDLIASHIVQESLDLVPRIDIEQHAIAIKAQACKKLSLLERNQQERLEWQDSVQEFTGTYRHVLYEQELEITPSGHVILRGKKTKESKSSTRMRAQRSGNILRLLPGDSGFGIDSWSVWSDLDFIYCEQGENIYLKSHQDGAQFRKFDTHVFVESVCIGL